MALAFERARSPTVETAERTGVGAHTLRYYERIGLLAVGLPRAGHRPGAEDLAAVDLVLTAGQTARLDALPVAGDRYPDTGWVERDTAPAGS